MREWTRGPDFYNTNGSRMGPDSFAHFTRLRLRLHDLWLGGSGRYPGNAVLDVLWSSDGFEVRRYENPYYRHYAARKEPRSARRPGSPQKVGITN
jgi:hypothetical protein